MKKTIILLLALCKLILPAITQTNNNGFGNYYDINGLPLYGYCDFDYSPEKVLKISLVVGEKNTPGAYYDSQGYKHEGYISFFNLTYEFRYKRKIADEWTSLYPTICTGIKMGKDSFAVIKDFQIKKTFGKAVVKEESFVEVIANTPKYKLYKHTKLAFSGPTETYVIKTDTSKLLTSIFNQETLLSYFGDCKVLRKQISNRYFKVEDLPSISKIYEYDQKYTAQKKIYYSDSWDEQNDSASASYYAKITNVKDTIWELTFYDMKGVSLYQGHFASFSPVLRHGEFQWFFPNGRVRKKATFKNDEIVGEVSEYYTNGNLHYTYCYKRNRPKYSRILDMDGKDILSNDGNGGENLFDSISNNQLGMRYKDHKLTLCSFLDNQGKNGFLQSEENAQLKSINSVQRQVNRHITYPEKSIKEYRHGLILVLFVVDTEGKTTDFHIIKGLDSECNNLVTKFINDQKDDIEWWPAIMKEKPIAQEIIVPFQFEITGMTIGNNSRYYNNDWMWRMQQQQMFNQPKLNLPRPSGFR